MLVAKGRPAQIKIEVRNFDDVLAAPTGSVAVVITDVDDLTVSSGNATSSTPTGTYLYTLPTAVTGTLGVYTATATYTLSGSTVTRSYPIEVVSDYLFDIHELRDMRSTISETNYPAALVRSAREAATVEIEQSAQVAFVKHVKRVTMSGDGSSTLLLPDVEVTEILSCVLYSEDTGVDDDDEILGTELIDIEVNRETGLVTRTDGQAFPLGSNNVVIDYEHGFDAIPEPIRQAAMTLAIEYLVPSGLPVRATAQSTDLGDFRISVANPDLGRDTGIPSVDAAIQKYGRRRPRLG